MDMSFIASLREVIILHMSLLKKNTNFIYAMWMCAEVMRGKPTVPELCQQQFMLKAVLYVSNGVHSIH